ncbi:MAG: hypothetical protein ABIJ86_11710 [Spirochaetota bacterium]
MGKRCLLLTCSLYLATVLLFAQEYDLDVEVDLGEALGVEETRLPFSLHGYVINYSEIRLIEDDERVNDVDTGNVLYLRLKGDFDPEEALHFHFEASYTGSTGNQNPFALFAGYGLIPSDQAQTDYPYQDFIQDTALDHVWGSFAAGPLDLQFGKMPIAWGTAYVFNPSSRVASGAFMETVSEETPGTLGIAPSIRILPDMALQAYLAFQDKSHSTVAVMEAGSFDNLPFGIKLQASAGKFDLSAGFIKEVLAGASYSRNYYLSVDFAGAVWNFGIYGEASIRLPGDGTSFSLDFGGYRFPDMLEVATGFDYSIPGIELSSRVEYYHHGSGASSKDLYDMSRTLSGELPVQGKDYAFLHFERVFSNYLTLSAGGLWNLNDLSGVLFPGVAYELYSNLLISAGAYFFVGEADTEFGGGYGIPPLDQIDLTESAVFFRLKLSF